MQPNMENPVRQPTARRVTIADVSEALGLTKSTVSRAMNGYPDIAESTRARVMRMAEKMGYRPLSHAQAIRTGRVRSIGFIIETAEHDAHRPFLAEFLAGISSAASLEGWTLTVAAASSPLNTLQIIEGLCADRKADGFILPRTLRTDDRIATLRRLQVPFVMFGRTGDPTDCAWYDIAGEDAMQSAVQKLAASGHRRIAFVNGGKQYNYTHLRHEGYAAGLQAAGLTFDAALVRENCMSPEDGRQAARALLALDQPPTGFVFAMDRAALGLYDAARDLGLQVGRDISVIAYDGIIEGATMTPPLSTFSVNIRRAGERLGTLLIRRVRGSAPETLRRVEQATFLDRGSAATPARSSEQLANLLRDTAAKP